MIPTGYFKNKNIAVENSHVFALFSPSSRDIYENCILKAASTMEWKCLESISPEGETDPDTTWESIKKAELAIIDISEASPEFMYQVGIALTVKDEENVFVISRSDELDHTHFLTEQIQVESYSTSNLEKLTDKIRRVIQGVERKRKGTAEVPSFKNLETKKVFDNAVKARRKEDWETAEILFKEANQREHDNWYLLMQWGVLYREKRDWDRAEKMFQDAINLTRYDDIKAHIYIEKAIMYQKADRIDDADNWFHKAENADNKNTKVYFAWAKFWDEVGNAKLAAEKIWRILNDIDDKNENAKNRVQYYTEKAMDSNYNKSFKEFMDAQSIVRKTQSPPIKVSGRYDSKPFNYHMSQKDIRKKGVGSIVVGTVNNVVSYGVFLTLSRDSNGLLHQTNLPKNWNRLYFKGQRVRARIIKFEDRQGSQKIHLEPVS